MEGAAPRQVDRLPNAPGRLTGTADARRSGRCETDHRGIVGRMTELLRAAFERPELVCYGRTVLRKIPGFDATGFIRFILALEAEFGIELHEAEIDFIETMGDVLALVKKRTPDVDRSAVNPEIELTHF